MFASPVTQTNNKIESSSKESGLSLQTQSPRVSRPAQRGWGSRSQNIMSAVTPTNTYGSFSSALIRPASEMQVMTPEEEEDEVSAVQITFASLNMNVNADAHNSDSTMHKDALPLPGLSPHAKEFVPSHSMPVSIADSVPAKMDYLGKSLGSVRSQVGKVGAAPPLDLADKNDEILSMDSNGGPASSVESVALKNGHSIPCRPTLCALQPNLPRWAHASSPPVKTNRTNFSPNNKRPSLFRTTSNTSFQTQASFEAGSERGDSDHEITSWRRKATNQAETRPGLKIVPQAGSRPRTIAADDLFSPERSLASSISRTSGNHTQLLSFAARSPSASSMMHGSRSWGIPAGSASTPVRVPRSMGTGLLGAVPMQGVAYR